MAVLAEYTAPNAPGSEMRAFIGAREQTASLMERKQRMRMAEEQNARQQLEAEIMRPLNVAKVQADVAKAKTDYDVALRLQAARQSAYDIYGQAETDFNYVNQITDAKTRADASREWLSRYSQLSNIKELAPQIETMNSLATKNIEGLLKVNMLGTAQERSFKAMTEGMDPEAVEQARQVQLGLRARPSSAAITYREVIGPDGRAQLVAVDPRAVGAQIVGSGQQYGSGVGETPESRALAQGQAPAQPNQLIGQTPYERASSTAQGTKDAEYQATLRAAKPKRQAALQQAEALTEQLTSDLDDLINKVTVATAGPGGVVLDKFPGTSARDLQSNLDSIKANIGFQALQAMREASPTGGALGNVSDTENRLLQSRFGSLEIGQSPKQLIDNLKKVRQRVTQNYGITQAAFNSEYGAGEESAAPIVIKSIKRID